MPNCLLFIYKVFQVEAFLVSNSPTYLNPILFAGRCIHALWDAARVVRSAGKWRFHVVHRAILHRDCAMQRKRAGNCGDCRRPINVACTTSQVQEHHHSQQHREVHRRVLDLRDRCRPLAFDLRENSGRSIARVRKDLVSILFGFLSIYLLIESYESIYGLCDFKAVFPAIFYNSL